MIYDVDLTLSLPVPMSGTSGMNAIAHAIEALYARDRNPIISMMAVEGIRAMARALPRIADRSDDRAARSDALYAAWLCGTCLGTVGMALHHKLCHTLGGAFDLPHAETHTAVLPHAFGYNAPAAPEALQLAGEALGTPNPVIALYELAQRIGAKVALRDLGMPEDGIDKAAGSATPTKCPRPRTRGDPELGAHAGDPPYRTNWDGRDPRYWAIRRMMPNERKLPQGAFPISKKASRRSSTRARSDPSPSRDGVGQTPAQAVRNLPAGGARGHQVSPAHIAERQGTYLLSDPQRLDARGLGQNLSRTARKTLSAVLYPSAPRAAPTSARWQGERGHVSDRLTQRSRRRA